MASGGNRCGQQKTIDQKRTRRIASLSRAPVRQSNCVSDKPQEPLVIAGLAQKRAWNRPAIFDHEARPVHAANPSAILANEVEPARDGRGRGVRTDIGRVQPGISERRQTPCRDVKIPIHERPLTPHEDPVKPQRLGGFRLVRRSQQRDRPLRCEHVAALTRMNSAIVCSKHVAERVAGGIIEGHRLKQV